MPNVVEERIKRWKNKLIDLTKRNRLLNFKPTKVTTIRIVDEIPAEVYSTLVINEDQMSFLPISEEEENGEKSAEELFDGGQKVPKINLETQEFESYDKKDLTDRHKDLLLQTNLSDKRLDKNLFRIASISSSVMEEQGYNVLFLSLGILEWYESKESELKFRAPILLVPVELTRKSVKNDYAVKYASEEASIINPALIHKLFLDFGINLEGLMEDLESVDPRKMFQEIKKSISNYPRWRLTNDVFLGLFSFNKFIMYKDIEKNVKALTNNNVIKTMCGIQPEKRFSLNDICPEDEISDRVKPLETFQVLDADSSQQRAIIAIKSGHNLIIEGPPGTGKSQTIANIIGESLFAGKRVLFVSQKMAALEVVKKRLEITGLGDYCLELHSRKSNKKRVAEELGRIMHQEKKPDHDHDQELLKLERLCHELNNYVKELHRPFGNLNLTPYKAIGILKKHCDIEDLVFLFKDVEGWDVKKFEYSIELLNRLAMNLNTIVEPNLHPWNGSELIELSYSAKLGFNDVAQSILEKKELLGGYVKKLCDICSYSGVDSLNDIDLLISAADILLQSPHTTKAILQNYKWNSIGAEVQELIDRVTTFNRLEGEITQNYNIKIIDEDIESLLVHYRKYSRNAFFFLIPSFWRNRKLVKGCLKKKRKISFKKYVFELEIILKAKTLALEIDKSKEIGIELFGEFHWNGRNTKGTELAKFADWIVKFRCHVLKKHFENEIFSEERFNNLDKDNIAQVRDDLAQEAKDIDGRLKSFIRLTRLDDIVAFGKGYRDTNLENVFSKVQRMVSSAEEVDSWLSYQRAKQDCLQEGLGDFIAVLLSKKINFEKYSVAFKCQFLRCWVDDAFAQRPALRNFNGQDHELLIETFRELDRKQIELAKVRIQHALSGNYDVSWQGSAGSERAILEREVRKQRAHKPLRRLFKEIPNLLLSLKPCLMMSPLTVAQFLDPHLFSFDLVIFDEASQVPPEDSIGAVMRGKQIVIAGDTKQLPPTSFFQSTVLTSEDSEEEDFDEYIPDDLDSILDECASSGFPKTMLKWHYRSRHESLIAFSNKSYYNYSLNTFPNAEEENAALGLKFNYLPNLVYQKGGVNEEEAREVAKRVFLQLKEYPDLSLGIGTFSIKQKYAIEDAIEELRKQDDSLEELFSTDRPEHFFVKNLEAIQGDERDVIFISIGYGKSASGRLSMNFGPINKLGGERRLNVLVTRARLRLEIFSSITGADFDLSKTNSEGVHLFKKYLDYAEHGKSILMQDVDFSMDTSFSESPFEEAVHDALIRAGIKIHQQVGCSGYRIDIAVVDNNNPGKYLLGIECDGACYHSCATARDRDRLRQQVLEDLGWNIFRVWSTDWYKNPGQEFEKLLSYIKLAQDGSIKKKLQNKINCEIKLNHSSVISTRPHQDIPTAYKQILVKNVGQPKSFYSTSKAKIADVLINIIDCEGPIHKDEARRRVIQHWNMNNVKSTIRSIMQDVEKFCSKSNKLIRKGDFFWPPEMRQVKIRSRDVEGITKKIELICPEEIEEAMKFILKKEFSMPYDSLITQTAKLFGFNRTGEDIYFSLGKRLDTLIKNEVILKQGECLILAKKE